MACEKIISCWITLRMKLMYMWKRSINIFFPKISSNQLPLIYLGDQIYSESVLFRKLISMKKAWIYILCPVTHSMAWGLMPGWTLIDMYSSNCTNNATGDTRCTYQKLPNRVLPSRYKLGIANKHGTTFTLKMVEISSSHLLQGRAWKFNINCWTTQSTPSGGFSSLYSTSSDRLQPISNLPF